MQVGLTFALVTFGWPLFFYPFDTYMGFLLRLATFEGGGSLSHGPIQWGYLILVYSWIFGVSENRVVFGDGWTMKFLEPVVYGLLAAVSISMLGFTNTFIYFRF